MLAKITCQYTCMLQYSYISILAFLVIVLVPVPMAMLVLISLHAGFNISLICASVLVFVSILELVLIC